MTTVDGPVELKIPSGTQPGTTLLMAKRGVPRLGNTAVRGDHQVGGWAVHARHARLRPASTQPSGLLVCLPSFLQHAGCWVPVPAAAVHHPPRACPAQVHVRVKIPKSISAEERKLVEQLKEMQGKSKGFGPFGF